MADTQFAKDFDTLLNDILTDYSNLDSAPDVTVGSMAFINGATLASMLWGLYRYQDWIAKQHFPDTADTTNLNHHGSLYDITRTGTDTDATYLNKILDYLRQPPAGGNANDYQNWALDQENSTVEYDSTDYYNGLVTVVDTPDNILGTVGVYTIPSDETIVGVVKSTGTNSGVVASKLQDAAADFVTDGVAVGDPVTNSATNLTALVTAVDDLNNLSLDTDIFPASPVAYIVGAAEESLRRETETYIETVRPLGLLSVGVFASDETTENIQIDVTPESGGTVDTEAIEDAVTAFLLTLKPGETLFIDDLTCLAKTYGADHATVNTPAANVTVDNDEHIRKGTITITEV